MDINRYIKDGSLKILVRPNSPKTEMVKWDEERKALRMNVHAKPENNEANIEIIRFFRKLTKKDVSIIGGKSKEKLLKFR
jgi:uncharacterized protein (TIGR00251 family)